MTNMAAFQQLQSLVHVDYTSEFANVDNVLQPQIPGVGEAIPKTRNGDIRYTTSLTPTQTKKMIAISLLVAAIIATTLVVIAAILMNNNMIFLGLIPTGGGIIGGICGIVCYYCLPLDLASPKQRQKEAERIRAHRLTLHQINYRYGGFGDVVLYKLMGEAPETSYRQAALLSQKQAMADSIYYRNLNRINDLYNQAVRPARRTYNYLNTAWHQALTVSTANRINRDLIWAEDQLEDTYRQVNPVRSQAIDRLNRDHRVVYESLHNSFIQLPL